jgi:hypothetical protein
VGTDTEPLWKKQSRDVVNAVMGKGGFMMRWRIDKRSLGVLALLFGLLTAFAPRSVEAQVTFTPITSSTGMDLSVTSPPSINADGTRIASNDNQRR